jgi:hypothetical protein
MSILKAYMRLFLKHPIIGLLIGLIVSLASTTAVLAISIATVNATGFAIGALVFWGLWYLVNAIERFVLLPASQQASLEVFNEGVIETSE